MSTYVALLEGGKREETVQVTLVSPGLYDVEIRGRVRRVEAFHHDAGTLSLIEGTGSHSVYLEAGGGDSAVKVFVGDEVHGIDVLDERRLRMRRAAGTFPAGGKQVVTAPMPGKVVKVLVKAGDTVRAGQGIAVLEAMKMENELRSPKDGKLTELLVAEGQPVEGGARIAVVE